MYLFLFLAKSVEYFLINRQLRNNSLFFLPTDKLIKFPFELVDKLKIGMKWVGLLETNADRDPYRIWVACSIPEFKLEARTQI